MSTTTARHRRRALPWTTARRVSDSAFRIKILPGRHRADVLSLLTLRDAK